MQALGISWRSLATRIRHCGPSVGLRKIVKITFSQKYLLYTNITISLTLSSLGDIIEQKYEIYTKAIDTYDFTRTKHMAFSGAILGMLCHHWYKVLDKIFLGRSMSMALRKLALDQFIFSPIMIVTFFGSVAVFEDNPLENFKEEVKDKFTTLYRAEWMVWPPAQIINFCFLPTRFRVLYDNVISLGYDIYTSHVKHKKPLKSPSGEVKTNNHLSPS